MVGEVPITRETAGNYQQMGVQFAQGPARAAAQLGDGLVKIGQDIEEQAQKKALLDYSNTMKQELFRIEQENQGEPEALTNSYNNFHKGFFSKIGDKEVSGLLEQQYISEIQPSIRRASQIKSERLDNDIQSASYTSMLTAQRKINKLAVGLWGKDPEIMGETAQSIETEMAIIQANLELKKRDGSYMFTPAQRAQMMDVLDDAMRTSAPLAWAAMSDEDKLAAIERAGVAPAPAADGKQPLSVRNNNPGNIRGKDGEFKKFATKEDGSKAMAADLMIKISGKSAAMERNFGKGYEPTLANVISTWAPPTENDTRAYIATVARETGIAADQVLTPADIKKIMPAMIKVEGGPNASRAFDAIKETDTPFDYLTPAQQAGELERVQDSMAIKSMQYAAPAERARIATERGTPAAIAALNKIDSELNKDPAAYVSGEPVVVAAEQAYVLSQRPEDFNAYVETSLAAQQRLGVLNRRVLPQKQADAIVAAVSDAFNNKQDVHALMMQQRQQYGANWPRVMTELQAAKLPASAVVLAAMDKEEQAPYAAMLSTAISEGADNVYTAAGTDAKKFIKEQVSVELDDFRLTMPAGQYAAFEEATMLLAAKIMTGGGDVATASTQAADIIANKYFNYESTYRVPKALNGGAIIAGADEALAALTPDILLMDSRIYGKVTPGDNAAALANIKRAGKWVNTPEGDGLILLQEDGLPVATKDGAFIRYTFEELEALGMVPAKATKERLDRSRMGVLP
jgi:hypothetical protein